MLRALPAGIRACDREFKVLALSSLCCTAPSREKAPSTQGDGGSVALALSAALVLGLAGVAYADDSPILTKAPPAPAPAAPAALPSCTNLWDFVATACPLSWYGITVYGTIDVGAGWELHSMPYNPVFGPGDFYPLAKASNISRFQYSPNALQQSVIGIKGIEPVWGQTSFIWTFEASFMPFEALADAPGSVYGQRGLALTNQLANGDGGRYGAIYNSGIGFAGFTNPVWGTLIVGRQNTLALDGVIAYDPMGGSYPSPTSASLAPPPASAIPKMPV